jgi:hypothetical protein
MLYTKITYTVEFKLAFTIMSFSGSESVYRRCLLRYLILPVCLLSLAQFAMYPFVENGPQVNFSRDSSVQCQNEFSCCIRVHNVGAFYIYVSVYLTPIPMAQVATLHEYYYGEWNTDPNWNLNLGSISALEYKEMPVSCDVVYTISIDVLSLIGWKNVFDETFIFPSRDFYEIQGLLFYEYVFILSIVADIFCIMASIVAFRTALKRFTVATIAAIGTIPMILSVIDLGVHLNQFPKSVLFLMAISMARIVGLLFVVAFCIRVKTKEINEEQVPLKENISINTQNEQEA